MENYNGVVRGTDKRGRERETIVDMLAVTDVMSGLTELEHQTSKTILICLC